MKNVLRNKYKKIRSDVYDKESKSNIIMNKIFNLDAYKNATVICVYMSFRDEVNTHEFITKSISNGKIIATPKVIDSNNIEFYRIHSLNDVNNISSFGINEPLDLQSNLVNKNDIDLIIVPGICFDKNNNRIGFGKGYYDRYLSNLPSKCFKLGICFYEQILKDDFIPIDNFDVQMDLVISEAL